MRLYPKIDQLISTFSEEQIPVERRKSLQSLTDHLMDVTGRVRLNFICTHNSRRSHLAQVWAHTWSNYYDLDFMDSYSGGTEETAVYPLVIDTLSEQGFEIFPLSGASNPVYSLKCHALDRPLILFSKKFSHRFNPEADFIAIMTCDSANEACPMVSGASKRFSVLYEDPKRYDGTEQQSAAYTERSLQIAQELWWVFAQVAAHRASKKSTGHTV